MPPPFSAFKDSRTAALVNHRLEAMRLLLPQITLRDLRIWVSHLHVGQGIYPKGFRVGRHSHPEIQIEAVLSGTGIFEFDNHLLPLRAGQNLFIPPDTSHSWHARSAMILVGITLNVSGPLRGEFVGQCREEHLHNRRVVEVGKEQTLPRIIRMMSQPVEALFLAEQSAGLFLGWLCRTLPLAFSLESWRVDSNRPLTREERAVDLVGKASRFMQDHFAARLRTAEIARRTGLSARQLNRLFEEFTQESVSQTLHRIRLNKAMEMLHCHPEYSIEGIASSCGFNSHSYFTQRFIAAFGVRPSEVRQSSPR